MPKLTGDAVATITPTKSQVDFGLDGIHTNTAFDKAAATTFIRTLTQGKKGAITKPGLVVRGAGTTWFFDTLQERLDHVALLTVAGVSELSPSLAVSPPENT